MGREIKRVPLNFSWPLREVWKGFKNPFYTAKECSDCDGTGYSPYAKNLQDMWYGKVPFDPESTGSKPFGANHPAILELAERNVKACKEKGYFIGNIEQEAARLSQTCFDNQWSCHLSQEDVDALIKEGRLYEITHTWEQGKGWKPKNPAPVVTAEMVNELSVSGRIHDSTNSYICIKAKCEKNGQERLCSECHGEGIIWPCTEDEVRYEEWEAEEPPTGEAYQLWETVSEGSPVSPPFATPEELASWLVMNDTSVTKDTTYDQWMKFINGPGWAPSAIIVNGVMKSGTQVSF